MARAPHTAIVTGGTRGIGAGIAARLRQDGHRVIITGTKQRDDLDPAHYICVDFLNEHEFCNFLEKVVEIAPDILVNNAGINIPAAFETMTLANYEAMERVNLRTPMLTCQAVVPAMKARHWGRIVNVSSIWAVTVKEERAPYCATKFGLVGLTTALAVEVAATGILANCVAPGFIETEATRAAFVEAELAESAKGIPMRRFGKPEEVGALVSWLVSEDNTYLTGQNILIDGGLCAV